jgi:hypothetical protein
MQQLPNTHISNIGRKTSSSVVPTPADTSAVPTDSLTLPQFTAAGGMGISPALAVAIAQLISLPPPLQLRGIEAVATLAAEAAALEVPAAEVAAATAFEKPMQQQPDYAAWASQPFSQPAAALCTAAGASSGGFAPMSSMQPQLSEATAE